MAQVTFFTVLKSNLKCAVCKNNKCPVRYYPERKIRHIYSGTCYQVECEKDAKKREEEFFKKLKRPLP